MQVLLAVFEDLYTFAAGTLLGWRHTERPVALPPSDTTQAHPSLESTQAGVYESAPEERQEVGAQDDQAHSSSESQSLAERTVAYAARTELALHEEPRADAPVLGQLSYGEMVMVLAPSLEWTYVATNGKKGYVPTASLARSAAEVYPDLEIGREYGPRERATLRLRTFIRDEFSATSAELPLSAHEYAYYRVLRRGGVIAWPEVRPRTPGAWAGILSALSNVSVSEEPEAGAVMEYALPEGRGHLAYVEEVYPDRSLKISEADWPDRGIYNERVLVEEEWRGLHPRFIVVG